MHGLGIVTAVTALALAGIPAFAQGVAPGGGIGGSTGIGSGLGGVGGTGPSWPNGTNQAPQPPIYSVPPGGYASPAPSSTYTPPSASSAPRPSIGGSIILLAAERALSGVERPAAGDHPAGDAREAERQPGLPERLLAFRHLFRWPAHGDDHLVLRRQGRRPLPLLAHRPAAVFFCHGLAQARWNGRKLDLSSAKPDLRRPQRSTCRASSPAVTAPTARSAPARARARPCGSFGFARTAARPSA